MATAVELLPREYGYVVLVLVLYTLLNFWMAGKYKVPYPTLYASESDNKEAKVFQLCSERPPELSGIDPLFFVLLLLGGLKHPCISAGLGLLYTVTRYFYFKGYSTGDPRTALPSESNKI
ncbi:microsomal glutathione s-transferase, putative [Prunus dulcis]|uniref:Microsomal glutathione s-transferase, putative n=1 Tax=Prunus dulcis TaxID=3755 RepID=A0A4Y1R6L5_PRUDU|nr:microsomal glutathione s-transferase, putative [Prunus dulcis]